MATILGSDAPLRERVLWTLLYESTARAEEVLLLDVPDLETANKRAVMTRKGGARDVIVWQTGTARGRARLSYRRAAEVFEPHHRPAGRTVYAAPAAPLGAHTRRRGRHLHPVLMALSGHTSVRSLAKYARVSAEALGSWRAERDPAGRRHGRR